MPREGYRRDLQDRLQNEWAHSTIAPSSLTPEANSSKRYGKVYLGENAGSRPGITSVELECGPSTAMICHDERYPEMVRLPAIQDARIVYYISHESGLREEMKVAP